MFEIAVDGAILIPVYALGCGFGALIFVGCAKVATALLGNAQELQDKSP
ncbi:MAG: hypothetical protein PHQ41_04045 [Candidatus Cloacimonetes bacterium]|nr:hypothetical protein [Candidatus Cloacimonadota bacterium]